MPALIIYLSHITVEPELTTAWALVVNVTEFKQYSAKPEPITTSNDHLRQTKRLGKK